MATTKPKQFCTGVGCTRRDWCLHYVEVPNLVEPYDYKTNICFFDKEGQFHSFYKKVKD